MNKRMQESLSISKQKVMVSDLKKMKKSLPKVRFQLPKYKQIADYNVKKIDPESCVVPGLKTICDVDHTFYKIIEGRPIRQFIDVKVYMRNLRDITLYRANTAYINDQIIQIDTNIADESKLYDEIIALYNETTTNFFNFVRETYDNAKKVQDCAEIKSAELNDMMKQLDGLSFVHVHLNNRILSLASSFGTLFRYSKFIHEISPIWWQNRNDVSNSVDFFKVIEEVESNTVESIRIYRDFFKTNKKPKLCFKKPQTLMRIFDNISRQCLNYMQIENYSARILKPVLRARDQLESVILSEANEVTGLIEYYETQVKWMEEKEAEYTAKFNKLLFTKFHELYASYDATKLFTCIQYIHCHLFDVPVDPKDNITTMMLNIEKLFIKLTSRLDQMNQNVIKKVEHEIFSSDIRMMKRAVKAQRSLKEFDILKKSLIASFEPPRNKHKKN
ncbi:unnamed protein product [Danaus chrysippus]|uniref:(African queen) hypothetical protein n=1 Tax=Danaus chrysippus TaxID=151541 RepID=A0A8J2W9F6_9NEOP|nr:unnamed protein product [Danaus chrysippus]